MKKFYTKVSTGPAVGGGFVTLLDGRPVRTPEKALMTAPNAALAAAVAAEWAAQGETVVPETMPLTQILTTSIDRAAQREAMTVAVLAYIDSDLLCYPADEPEELRQEQEKIWSPWLKWFERTYGIEMQTTYSLARIDQPAAIHEKISAEIEAYDFQHFSVLQTVVGVTGSIILGLAFMRADITAVEAWRCALCEELLYERVHDLEKYGADPIEGKRRDALLRDLEAASLYLKLLRSSTS